MTAVVADGPAPDLPMEMSMTEYFLGVLLPRGFQAFEETLNPVVKREMNRAFPDQQKNIDAKEKFRREFQARVKHYHDVVKPKEAEAREAEEIKKC